MGFQKVKHALSLPLTMAPLFRGLPLTFYLPSTDKSIGALLEQEVEGVEHHVYYLGRSL